MLPTMTGTHTPDNGHQDRVNTLKEDRINKLVKISRLMDMPEREALLEEILQGTDPLYIAAVLNRHL